jgi:hypothetical protein
MNSNELSEEQKKLVWRYVTIWHRFRRPSVAYRSLANLDDNLAQGYGMFLCGLSVEARSSSIIGSDFKKLQFCAAIFGDADSALLDTTLNELQQARRYIIPLLSRECRHHPHRTPGVVALCPSEARG